MALTVQLGEGLHRLPTFRNDLINTFVLVDDEGLTLVDAGVKGASPRIIAGLAELGFSTKDVTRIVATHGHSDHVGGLKELADQTSADVAVHVLEADDVTTGRGQPLDPTKVSGRLRSRGPGSAPCTVTEPLTDGQLLPVGGGLKVLHTSGHSPGHVSLLHLASSTLITGDAIWNMFDRRTWSIASFCSNAAMSEQTAAVLADEDYVNVAFTHGREILETGRESVRSFLAAPRSFWGRRKDSVL